MTAATCYCPTIYNRKRQGLDSFQRTSLLPDFYLAEWQGYLLIDLTLLSMIRSIDVFQLPRMVIFLALWIPYARGGLLGGDSGSTNGSRYKRGFGNDQVFSNNPAGYSLSGGNTGSNGWSKSDGSSSGQAGGGKVKVIYLPVTVSQGSSGGNNGKKDKGGSGSGQSSGNSGGSGKGFGGGSSGFSQGDYYGGYGGIIKNSGGVSNGGSGWVGFNGGGATKKSGGDDSYGGTGTVWDNGKGNPKIIIISGNGGYNKGGGNQQGSKNSQSDDSQDYSGLTLGSVYTKGSNDGVSQYNSGDDQSSDNDDGSGDGKSTGNSDSTSGYGGWNKGGLSFYDLASQLNKGGSDKTSGSFSNGNSGKNNADWKGLVGLTGNNGYKGNKDKGIVYSISSGDTSDDYGQSKTTNVWVDDDDSSSGNGGTYGGNSGNSKGSSGSTNGGSNQGYKGIQKWSGVDLSAVNGKNGGFGGSTGWYVGRPKTLPTNQGNQGGLVWKAGNTGGSSSGNSGNKFDISSLIKGTGSNGFGGKLDGIVLASIGQGGQTGSYDSSSGNYGGKKSSFGGGTSGLENLTKGKTVIPILISIPGSSKGDTTNTNDNTGNYGKKAYKFISNGNGGGQSGGNSGNSGLSW